MIIAEGRHAAFDLKAALAQLKPLANAVEQLHELLSFQLNPLPLPGSGATLERWQALAQVAQHSLSLAKLYEGHHDALATLAELEEPSSTTVVAADGSWGVWAAESANTRVTLTPSAGSSVLLNGTKCWCSGAQTLSHGLLTAWLADGQGPYLVRVVMNQPSIEVSASAWQAVGMVESASVDIIFTQALAHRVAYMGDYLSRPGFWQGGAGIAACWYGGTVGLANVLRQTLIDTMPIHWGPYKLAALGKVDLALSGTAVLLRHAAQWIDDHPLADASTVALRCRLAAERCAATVLDETGRALGASAFCLNGYFARMAADLPVFIRQSHAERDFAALAERVIPMESQSWCL